MRNRNQIKANSERAPKECVDFYGIVGETIRQIALQSAATDLAQPSTTSPLTLVLSYTCRKMCA